jgi:hypothetical protein
MRFDVNLEADSSTAFPGQCPLAAISQISEHSALVKDDGLGGFDCAAHLGARHAQQPRVRRPGRGQENRPYPVWRSRGIFVASGA